MGVAHPMQAIVDSLIDGKDVLQTQVWIWG